jgi:hypothetical protein
MESANKDPSLPHALGSCWQGVHGGQFRLLLDKRIGDAVTFAVHGGGSLFGVSAIKRVAIGDQLSTFELGHAQAAPAFGRADQSGIHKLEHSALAECMQDYLDASPLLTGHGNERHLQQPSQPAVPAKVDDKVRRLFPAGPIEDDWPYLRVDTITCLGAYLNREEIAPSLSGDFFGESAPGPSGRPGGKCPRPR